MESSTNKGSQTKKPVVETESFNEQTITNKKVETKSLNNNPNMNQKAKTESLNLNLNLKQQSTFKIIFRIPI